MVSQLDQHARERECWAMFAVSEDDIARAIRDDFRWVYSGPPEWAYVGSRQASFYGGPAQLHNIPKESREAETLLTWTKAETDRYRKPVLLKPRKFSNTYAMTTGLLVHQMVEEQFELTQREIECWLMFGIRVEWFMDELLVTAP